MSGESPKPNNGFNSLYIKLIFVVLVVVGLTLPFHYVPKVPMVFPKEQLTFSNTIVTQQDIDYILSRYNNARNIFEQQTIASEPLFRKLSEMGIIGNDRVKNTDENDESDSAMSEDVPATDEEPGQPLEYLNRTVQMKFKEWENHLIDNSILDCIRRSDCDEKIERLKRAQSDNVSYDFKDFNGMGIQNPRYIPFNFNSDGVDDYVITYELENCNMGNAWTKDFVFIISQNESGYIVNADLATSIKSHFLDLANQHSEMDSYVYLDNGYIDAKGLDILSIENDMILGNFSLSGENGGKWPSIQGTWNYNLKSKLFRTTIIN